MSLRRIVAELRPNDLCLQEIEVENELYQAGLWPKLGLAHLHVQKSFHGVAVLSKLALEECYTRRGARSRTAGTRSARCRGIGLHHFYIPAAADVPDPG